MDPGACAVIIPALDEEPSIPLVLGDLARAGFLGSAIVVDNGSRDATARAARAAGARVVSEPRRGYGSACLRGLSALPGMMPEARVVVFMDADHSDDAALIPDLAGPILENRFDLVIGSRSSGAAEPGSLLPHQRLGNAAVCFLIRALFAHRYTDLGPFRAIRLESLRRLAMRDRSFGWTAEMQVKAILEGLRVTEIPVSYRKRVGVSKISGTIGGSAKAAVKIGWTVAGLYLRSFSPSRGSS